MTADIDKKHMSHALALAKRLLGNTSPNPSVGCVIVKEGKIIGKGWTEKGGRPHAEVGALKMAGKEAQGATAYVSLEPCSHKGKTGPCADALIKAGIEKCVIATRDINPKVSGDGIKKLKKAGIEVVEKVLEAEATELNKGFFLSIKKHRPLVTLKLATTMDGKLSPEGESNWFTGKRAKDFAHTLRFRNDAILVGINTVINDDPKLTCRLSGLEEFSPTRLIADRNLKIPLSSKIVRSAKKIPTIIFTSKNSDKEKIKKLKNHGVKIIYIEERNQKLVIKDILKKSSEEGITRLLVEGGGKIAKSFFEENFCDEFIHIKSLKIRGDETSEVFSDYLSSKLKNNFIEDKKGNLGEDEYTVYKSR